MLRPYSAEWSRFRRTVSCALLVGLAATGALLPGPASAAPPPLATSGPTSEAAKLGLGITLADARSKLAQMGYSFKVSPLGLEATAPTGIFTIVLSGPVEDLTWIGALMGVPSDREIRAHSLLHLVGFLLLTMDGWDGGGDWVAANTQASIEREVSAERGRHRLTMHYTPSLGIVNFGVEGLVPEAERRLIEARAALTEGDSLLAAGRVDEAISTWQRAERVDETRRLVTARVQEARVSVIRGHLDAHRYEAALGAAQDLVDGDVKYQLIGDAARGMLPSNPSAALMALESSTGAKSRDAALYRDALLGAAREGCAAGSLSRYDAAKAIAPLNDDDSSRAAECASTMGAKALSSKDYRSSVEYFRAGMAYNPQQSGVVDLRGDLAGERRNPGVVPGVILVAGGTGLAATSAVFWGGAASTSTALRAEERSTSEVEALISQGKASQARAWAFAGGGLGLIGGGLAAFVLGADRVPDELRGVDLAVVPMERGAIAMLTVREF